jgi:hypothetical protein
VLAARLLQRQGCSEKSIQVVAEKLVCCCRPWQLHYDGLELAQDAGRLERRGLGQTETGRLSGGKLASRSQRGHHGQLHSGPFSGGQDQDATCSISAVYEEATR